MVCLLSKLLESSEVLLECLCMRTFGICLYVFKNGIVVQPSTVLTYSPNWIHQPSEFWNHSTNGFKCTYINERKAYLRV